jgi:hypothetical protein
MRFFFGDDSRQSSPTRPKMGPLVAAGGVLVSHDQVRSLESALSSLCRETGFPGNDEFKWSPGRELWMRDHLIGQDRSDFFCKALALAATHGAVAIVVIEDTGCRTATRAKTPEDDVSQLLLERIHHESPRDESGCVVVVDRPSGDRGDEDRFLSRCLEHLQTGTDYVKHDRIALNVLSTPSKLVRILQLADLVTSCTAALFSGENRYAPEVFQAIRPILAKGMSRIGGVGLKIQPDFKYANLYHWLLGDTHYYRMNCGLPYPLKERPYCKDAVTY